MPLRTWLSRLLALFHKQRFEADLNDEIRAHLSMAEAENLRCGMSPEEARRAARRAFGVIEPMKAEHRDQRGILTLESIVQDLRSALRSVRRSPAFALVVVAALALGIGSTTAVFSVVDRILFRSLPYPQGEQLVSFGFLAPIDPQEFMLGPDYFEWRQRQEPFASMTSWSGITNCDLAEDNPVRLTCANVDAQFLPTFGVQPLLGRNFTADEDRPNAPKVAVISHSFWQGRFGGDPQAVGKTFSLDGQPATIVGVLPPDFELPTLAHADLLVPQAMSEAEQQRPNPTRLVHAFARLRSDVTPERAALMLQPLFQDSLKFVPQQFRKEVSLRVRPLRDRQIQDVRLASLVLLGAVLAVLLIACANVANLLLARNASRQRERAVRAALGAGRGRLMRQSITESLLFGLLGGAAGCALAWGLLRLVASFAPENIPRLQQAALDGRVLLFALGVSLFSVVLFGALPVLEIPRTQALMARRQSGDWRGWFRESLVVTQIAISLMLLVGGGLLLRSLSNLQSVPLGMRAESVITASISLGRQHYSQPAQILSFFDEVEQRLRSVPGVDTLALSDSLPPAGTPRSTIYSVIGVEGRPRAPEGTGGMVVWRAVTPSYFSALGIPIVQGRGLTEEDRRSDNNVTILSEALARRMFPGEDPLNKRIQPGGEGPWFTVVGIAGDVKNAGLESADQPEFYLVRKHLTTPFSEHDARFAGFLRSSHVIVRTSMNPEVMTKWMRAEVAAIDPALPLTVETMTQRVGQLAERPRFNALLLALFAGLGLALASIGLYGVVSFLVTQRTQEIGIRMALGATPRGVARLVLAQAARWTLLGTMAGLAGAALSVRFLETLLFGISGYDPVTLGLTVAVLAFVALLAAWIPARRAARVDPLAALRQE